jgi:serine/threonine protein kinase
MDTKQVVARFEAERQALAMMDHPNIAKVLDAGTTELGRPYFVMELVRGIRITNYCDQNQLSTKERLDLFIKVCQAIQHAHQKGIIHRDIKPSNILVTLHDGVPVPKVIDFGIAKAIEGKKVKVVLRESITAGEKDYSGLVSKLKSAGIEVMAYGGYHTEVALILRQAQQAGLKLTVMGGDTMTNSELVTAAGAASDNVLFTFSPDPRKNPAAADIVKRFRDAKVEPEGYVMYAYAAMQFFAQAAEQAKSTKYADLEKAMRGGSFDTVIGKLTFDAKGDNKLPGFMVYQWKGGKYDYVSK